MQAPQRPSQRRSPASDSPGPPPTISARAISPSLGPQPRNSTASAKSVQSNHSGSGRRPNGGQPPTTQNGQNPPPLSQIEKSVTHLLVATKQLLETLTQWSRHQATDAQVSDVYVRLGYEFNIACRAFTAINVDTSDLGNVPELLRHILESTLSQEASVESLERYLPRIRDIIINLLHGLKRKQQKLRQKQGRDSSGQNGEGSIPRNGSFSSIASNSTGLTTLLDQGLSNNFQGESGSSNERGSKAPSATTDSSIPPRMSSASGSTNRRGPPPRDSSRGSLSSDQSTLSSTTMQNIPVLPPYPGDEVSAPARPENNNNLTVDNFPPPPPPPKQTNALAALQRGGDLERRASRRYSAYQISKLVGASPNGVPMLPVPQNSPIPNRGRNDARESMRAVQNRGDQRSGRLSSQRLGANDSSPSRVPSRIAEEDIPTLEPPDRSQSDDSPIAKTPDDKLRQSYVDFDGPSATLNGPPADAIPSFENESPEEVKVVVEPPQTPEHKRSTKKRESTSYSSQERQFTPEESPPPPDKEITIFLQYKTKVKKFVLADGYKDLSMARLQLAFIERFAWNTHNNGVDLPEIYIQDPVSGVRHELEDLQDIKDRSVLVLNVEVLDEVKRHIDDSLGGLKKMVEGVKTAVDDQQVALQRVSDRQQDAAKEMARLAAAPSVSARNSFIDTRPMSNGNNAHASKISNQAEFSEIQSLRRDLAVLRQTYSAFQSDIQGSMSLIRTKANSVKSVAVKASIPDINGDSGRAYVNIGKKNLSEDSDKLVAQVDDLQDIVEDLRKDVVQRGVRPLPKQLETVAKDISQATLELKKMQEFLKRERPIWTKIWEKELETVCNDREEITMQEDLAADLQDDLEKAAQTFALVEQATKEQLKDGSPGHVGTGRNLSRSLNRIEAIDPATAKEGVLDEVRALQPNHENRLEAIERAEKLRQKELESRRGNELQKEIAKFVEEGRLRKSGGFEEVERQRLAKDAKIRKEVWERQNGMTQADADVGMEEGGADDLELGEEEMIEGDEGLEEGAERVEEVD
ncbi:actin interacting 3 protein [Rutstroemia sp. NJR-2017a WRK4]|nr:actin interacting 3 protein [Rutstroemia sp. NJR-2017a WRK4]